MELSALRSGMDGGEERAAPQHRRADQKPAHRENCPAGERNRALAQAREACGSAANVISGHTLRMEAAGRKRKRRRIR